MTYETMKLTMDTEENNLINDLIFLERMLEGDEADVLISADDLDLLVQIDEDKHSVRDYVSTVDCDRISCHRDCPLWDIDTGCTDLLS